MGDPHIKPDKGLSTNNFLYTEQIFFVKQKPLTDKTKLDGIPQATLNEKYIMLDGTLYFKFEGTATSWIDDDELKW